MSAETPETEFVDVEPISLSSSQRYIVLAAAFLGWMFAGLEMNIIPIAGRPAIQSFLSESAAGVEPSKEEVAQQVGKWFSRYICAFLLGAALGGLVFGWLGDHIGRSKAMALSILCYSLVTGASYYVNSLEQLFVLRFIACMGIGGMWPNGVALASEAWSEGSRPLLAGLIGTAANVGFVVLGLMVKYGREVTPEDWRWVMLVGGAPALLGVLTWFGVPESPHWLAKRKSHGETKHAPPVAVVFRPPYLGLTIIGVLLGTVPLLGGWGTLNWIIPWADKVGGTENPGLKATVSIWRSTGAALGSLLGGWLASRFGRRGTYFTISLLSLSLSGYIFWTLNPESPGFLIWVFSLGFVATTFFGWLPLYLPELFPTAVRATGSGVTFNFGRIIAAVGVLGTGTLLSNFNEDYARVGRITHLIYLLGMLVILFAPDTSGKRLED